MSQSSLVQVLVKASGKNASRTFFPRSLDSVTELPTVDGRVKSGASLPTAGTWLVMVCAFEVRRSTQKGRRLVPNLHQGGQLPRRSSCRVGHYVLLCAT